MSKLDLMNVLLRLPLRPLSLAERLKRHRGRTFVDPRLIEHQFFCCELLNENAALRKKLRALGANVAETSKLKRPHAIDGDYPEGDGNFYGSLPEVLTSADLVKPKKPGKAAKDHQRFGFDTG